MHCIWKHLQKYSFTMDRQFPRTNALSLFSVVMCMCFCTFLNSQAVYFRALTVLYLNKLPVNVPHWRICTCALAEPDTILLWHKMENACSIPPVLKCLSMGRLKPIQTKCTLYNSESVEVETTRGELLAPLCHRSYHIIIDLSLPLSSPVCLCPPESFSEISHGSLLLLISCVW